MRIEHVILLEINHVVIFDDAAGLHIGKGERLC